MKTMWVACALVALQLAGCVQGSEQRGPSIEPYDVVEPTTAYGPGAPVEVAVARLTDAGSLQVLVHGFACGAPSRVEVDETESEVLVSVDGAQYDEDALCTAEVVPWYVPVPTEEPLGSRALRSRGQGEIAVVDCRSAPSHPRCRE